MPPAIPTDAHGRSPNRQTRQLSQHTTAEPTANSPEHQTGSELANLGNAETQEKYWHAYFVQQRRRSCPGCGDDGAFF